MRIWQYSSKPLTEPKCHCQFACFYFRSLVCSISVIPSSFFWGYVFHRVFDVYAFHLFQWMLTVWNVCSSAFVISAFPDKIATNCYIELQQMQLCSQSETLNGNLLILRIQLIYQFNMMRQWFACALSWAGGTFPSFGSLKFGWIIVMKTISCKRTFI